MDQNSQQQGIKLLFKLKQLGVSKVIIHDTAKDLFSEETNPDPISPPNEYYKQDKPISSSLMSPYENELIKEALIHLYPDREYAKAKYVNPELLGSTASMTGEWRAQVTMDLSRWIISAKGGWEVGPGVSGAYILPKLQKAFDMEVEQQRLLKESLEEKVDMEDPQQVLQDSIDNHNWEKRPYGIILSAAYNHFTVVDREYRPIIELPDFTKEELKNFHATGNAG